VAHYGASKCYEPTHNLVTYHRILLVMVPCCDYMSVQNFEANCHFVRFLLPLNPVWESSTLLDATSSFEKIVVSLPQNL
jgi:hypothetical protein